MEKEGGGYFQGGGGYFQGIGMIGNYIQLTPYDPVVFQHSEILDRENFGDLEMIIFKGNTSSEHFQNAKNRLRCLLAISLIIGQNRSFSNMYHPRARLAACGTDPSVILPTKSHNLTFP